MALGSARHQKPGQPGRTEDGSGEAATGDGRDEARLARQGEEGSGQDLLAQVLSKANLERAWKRVKSNRGSAGVDGLSVSETAEYLKTQWPRARGIAQWALPGTTGTSGADSEGRRRLEGVGDSDGYGPADPTSDTASIAADDRSYLL